MAPKFNNNTSIFIFLLLSVMLVLSSRPVTAQSPPSPDSNSKYGYFSSGNATSSMLIIIILLISAFFLFGFFSVYIRQCTGEEILGAGPGFQTPATNRPPKGLDPAIIEKLPIMLYSEVKDHKVGKRVLECAVCLSEFEDDEKLRLLPECAHVFHPDCIDAWFSGHATCPVCRCNLTDYKTQEVPNRHATIADDDGMLETTTEIIPRREEERPVGPRVLPADAVILEVETETEEERRDREEATELERIRSMRRAAKSKSGWRPPRFPRSHSTGHSLSSLSRTGEDHDRYTLRLPDHVLRQIIIQGKLKRSTSALALKETGEGSSRPGYRGTGEGSSRGGRSIRMFVRDLSERFSSWGIGRRGDGEGSAKGEGSTVRGRLESVRVQFDRVEGGPAAPSKAESGDGGVDRRVD